MTISHKKVLSFYALSCEGEKGNNDFPQDGVTQDNGTGYKENRKVTSLGFSCTLLVSALSGAILSQVSDEKVPALSPRTDLMPIAALLRCQLAGLPEFATTCLML